MSARACQDCGSQMTLTDTSHGGQTTFRKMVCKCGSRFESEERIARRLPPAAVYASPRPPAAVEAPPPLPTSADPPASAGGAGGGLSESSPSESDPNTQAPLLSIQTRARSKPRAESPAFVAFYSRFPRKEKRPNACGAWVKHGCDEIADAVMAGLERWMPEFARRAARDPGTIPHPASWLNGKQWNDEPPKAAPLDLRCRFHRLPNTRGKMPDRAPPLDGCPECKHAKAASGRRESSPTPISDMLPTWMGEPASADELAALRKERNG